MIWSFFPPSCKKMNPETATCTTNATGWQPAFNRKKPLMAQAFQAGPHAKMCMLWFNTDLPTWFLLSFTPPGEEYIFGLGRVRQFRVGISCPGLAQHFCYILVRRHFEMDQMDANIFNIMHSSFLAAILWVSAVPGWRVGNCFSQKAWDNLGQPTGSKDRENILCRLVIDKAPRELSALATLPRCREATIRTAASTSGFKGGVPCFRPSYPLKI